MGLEIEVNSMEEMCDLMCNNQLPTKKRKKNMNQYGFKNCIVIYETTEKVRYDENGEVIGTETAMTARKVDLENEDRTDK